MIKTLEEAIQRIDELEAENKKLKAELEAYKSRSTAGRKKHDKVWTASYNDFAVKYGDCGRGKYQQKNSLQV